jgi:hypothetical protein
MEFLARLGIATAELFEAEGRSLRRNLVRLAAAAAIGIVVLLLALAGLAFVLFGVYLALAQRMSPPDAAMTMGATALLLAVLGVILVKRLV